MQIHAMAQIARRLRVLSAGNPRGIAMVYLSFDVAREQNEKVSGQEESLHGSITLGSLKYLRTLMILAAKRLRLCHIGSERFLIGCTGFKLQKPVEIACIKLVLNNTVFLPFALGTSLCQFSRYTTRIFQHISVHQ